MVSEIVGIGASWEPEYRARGVRRDPFETSKNVKVLASDDRTEFKIAKGNERGAKRPSELGLASVPFDVANAGVTIEYAEQTTTLSLICLRRLRFPLRGAAPQEDVDVAARTVLAALGLAAATLAFEAGTDLRSRCLLWPDGPMVWELLERPGSEPRQFALEGGAALRLLNDAVAGAKAKGLPWPETPIVLRPSAELVELVRLSQLEATKQAAAEA
jgi:CRISPR-associated protein Csb1